MDISNQVGQISSSPGLGQTAQIFAQNQAKASVANTVLPLLAAAAEQSNATRAINPAHLGQNVDIRT